MADLAPLGLAPVEEIGSGMEGTVIRLEGDLVAKVWHAAAPDDLAVRQAFYADVADALPLRTTRILDVVRVGDRWASIEPLLHGIPLAGPPTDLAADAVADVLAALGAATPTPAMTTLGALPGEPPLDVSGGFEDGLADLVERRANDVLATAVPGLPAASVAAAVRALPPAPAALVHGDLIPANVLLDDTGRPSAVIDFGFLTTVGDPAFDAAVTASIFDMYGDAARSTEARLDARLGVDPRRAAVHRAAYAVVTATCFSPTGDDGHFRWCVAMLGRDDVRAALS
ncbi:phosphotransferase [Nocardioides panacis]|uniref:Phosphotransferase n=1 Tax=Nocardioides panacis TaxID=2849501 RepID=A0A975T186_9ACTN|nr:phosphotransferase [Nocardioides panacis]QWZ09024.1 phosphotransferase [Nocardioides panacis]